MVWRRSAHKSSVFQVVTDFRCDALTESLLVLCAGDWLNANVFLSIDCDARDRAFARILDSDRACVVRLRRLTFDRLEIDVPQHGKRQKQDCRTSRHESMLYGCSPLDEW